MFLPTPSPFVFFIGHFWIQDQTKHVHIWHGSHHHHFKQKLGVNLADEDESQHKPGFEAASKHPQGTVVAPMAGLVVKVLMKNGDEVGEGQSVLVLEAMKMEVCNRTVCLFYFIFFLMFCSRSCNSSTLKIFSACCESADGWTNLWPTCCTRSASFWWEYFV